MAQRLQNKARESSLESFISETAQLAQLVAELKEEQQEEEILFADECCKLIIHVSILFINLNHF